MSSSPSEVIRLRGVSQNNLKNFDIDLPLRQLIVVTGLSGSGKSSFAFDTLFAEGQRRYIETFSPYARQFFDRMDKPRVDSIQGIPPAIAIEQRNAVRTTRSTVGTMTEVCDYMKMVWPHISELHCRGCDEIVTSDSPELIWNSLRPLRSDGAPDQPDEAWLIGFDLPLSERLSWRESLDLVSKQGFQRLLIDGNVVRIEDARGLPQSSPTVTVVQDRFRISGVKRARFVESCEQAFHFGKNQLSLYRSRGSAIEKFRSFSHRRHCARCDLEYRDPTPALFSFNNPLGACPTCRGFGRIISIDDSLVIPDHGRTLSEGAVKPWQSGHGKESQDDLMTFCQRRNVPVDVPFGELTEVQRRWVVEGDLDYGKDRAHRWPRAWYGVRGYFRWLESKAYKMHVRVLLSRYRTYTPCSECNGARFQPESLLYRVEDPGDRKVDVSDSPSYANRGDALEPPESLREVQVAYRTRPPIRSRKDRSSIRLSDFYQMPVGEALKWVNRMVEGQRFDRNDPIAMVMSEVRSRLAYLDEIGLGYLTLDRPTRTLSGGETERVNLTTSLGGRLVNTLFVLDEPSVGLHPHDTERLIRILERLRDAGNTVVVVEHEASVIRAADQIVDLGPGHGEAGGHLVFQGTSADILRCEGSLTGQYLGGRLEVPIPDWRPTGTRGRLDPSACLTVDHVSRHNLRDLTVSIPLERFVCISGVSGSGKTTLVREVLLPTLKPLLSRTGAAALRSGRSDEDADQQGELATKPGASDEPDPEADDSSASASGHERFRRVVLVDQSALGKTPRSNPAVYVGAFDGIRKLFARSVDARRSGLGPGAFSFNSREGQCERCRGVGFEKIEMQFLSDVFVRCPDCDGKRYRDHVLDIRIQPDRSPSSESPDRLARSDGKGAGHDETEFAGGWSIADMLDATVTDAIRFLEGFEAPAAANAASKLALLSEVGLGYLRLGQPINTLSGGECQRLKLVMHMAELGKVDRGESILFLFDEPTTGLHFEDVRILLGVFQRLVDSGHSLVVIEHNLDVIKSADWIIDLGPGAGADGGCIVVAGNPNTVAACSDSRTGAALRAIGIGAGSGSEVGAGRGTRKPGPRKRSARRSGQGNGRPGPDRSGGHVEPAFDLIQIRGAREHNLQNIDVDIPRDQFVAISGVSGSGKSTLAFDLLFAEGQRRFLDSMNAYARQFVEQLSRPDVDLVQGIPPTVSIEQRTSRGGGKSTVATVTEIYHFIRLLFARLGLHHCPDCGCPVEAQSRDALGRRMAAEARRRGDLTLLAPVIRHRKGFHTEVAEWAARHGYHEIRADGKILPTSRRLRLRRFAEHNIEIVVGTLSTGNRSDMQRLIDSALSLGKGTLFAVDAKGTETVHSTERVCPDCGKSFGVLDPKIFSYNSAQGWCPECRGFGETFYLPDVERGARADAIEESWYGWQEGDRTPCPACDGARLNPIARAVRLNPAHFTFDRKQSGPTIDVFGGMSVDQALDWFLKVTPRGSAAVVSRDILPEIRERLRFLDEVGLGYLELGRGVPTLSGGESQRIRLAAQLGSNLSGVLYILDEPTIGLHARDNEQLLKALRLLKNRGNSLVVVEHDEATLEQADHIIDLGPGAGVNGGRVIGAGSLEELKRQKESITGQSLNQQTKYPTRGKRRPVRSAAGQKRAEEPALFLTGANTNNLRNVSVRIPLNRFVAVTGVSGSGKSTLVRECLLPAVQSCIAGRRKKGGGDARGKNLDGADSLRSVYEVDQTPIGRTPRSIPATYVGFFDAIRALFARLPEARLRGYGPGRFSFNSPQGRCPECSGAGNIKLEMNFLPPAYVRCESCQGTRFNADTLDIEYRGKNIAQILDLSVGEALSVFDAQRKIRDPLEALCDTGLEYLRLGQISPTLSGGEAQRVKLVTHLISGLKDRSLSARLPARGGKRAKETANGTAPAPAPDPGNLFILEEPTIGLHHADVRRLVQVLQRLVDAGHTVIVIEHNLDLIAEADWVIDLGPEGGAGGGRLVVEGTPEKIARHKRSHTGRFLRPLLS